MSKYLDSRRSTFEMSCVGITSRLLLLMKIYTISLTCIFVTLTLDIYALYFDRIAGVPSNYEYDHIIVGAGTAGTTILDGMSENDKVLLIDAGSMSPTLTNIPVIAPIIHGTQYNWAYRTIRQTASCLALNDWSSNWSSGKGYGGSNILNNMIASWGHKEDFRGWFGQPAEYEYSRDIFPYFNHNNDFPATDELHNVTKFGEALLTLQHTEGVKFHRPKVYQKNGWRWSMAHESYERLKPTHEILTGTLATRVIFEQPPTIDGTITAKGVEIISSTGERSILIVRKSIILSAGAIGTPKILLQSGIGPCDELTALGITCRQNLPVGRNLQDHISTGLDLITLDVNLRMGFFDLASPENLYNFFQYGEGPLSHCGCDAIGFLENENSMPELGFMAMPIGITADSGALLRHVINLNETWWDGYFRHIVNDGQQAVSILPIVLHPKSRGSVRLRSKNPLHPPLIDPQYLSDQYDVDVLVKGLILLDTIVSKNAELQKLGAKINDRLFPGCENFEFKSKSYWECYVRHLTLTVYHPVGTCAIGEVITEDFRVLSTTNLFVVDGSVLKNLPSGNPNAVISMLARRFVSRNKA